ncbi:hypothetical protein A0H81_08086 [Grifola frondosa]|uniref:Uncharacterized protein n=1 Tax=Grifola frondosa TaxID=5627 RepID=A0A1C7M687_GRIFR|nr:hypothetical protein A0H81_08086 [Grifola frondosa]
MQMAQAAMHARGQQQQAQRAAAQSQAGDGSPTRVSPVSQQGPMQAQSPLGSFPYSGHVSNPADPRTALSGLTPQQQQAMLANMPSQQRQLLLMQQQMMRGANVGNVPNPAGMMSTPQMLAAAQERMRLDQRMSQMGSTHHAGSSMTGMEGNQFPALRSNPGVPGIARSQRTPSDSLPSPISQQRLAGQMSEDQQRAMMMQQAQQRGMTPHMQNPGFAQGGGGSLHNAGWSHGGSQQSAQMGHAQGGFSMSSPGSGGNGGSYGALPGEPLVPPFKSNNPRMFSRLTPSDKDAFFALLDEYFASRPESSRILEMA